MLEGGFNQPIKDMLRRHRGMTSEHAKTAVAWWLPQHTPKPANPYSFVKPHHWNPPKRSHGVARDEQIGPAVYDTAFSPEDGNRTQQG